MKKTIYWRNIAYGLTLKDCQQAFYNRAWQGTLYDTIMIAHGDHKLEYGKTNFMLEKFTFDEATDSNWSIFVPDYEEEKALSELREQVKNCNCTGVSFAKIDHMSIEEIWNIIEHKFDKETKLKMITLYIDNIYLNKKTITSLPKKVSIHTSYGAPLEVYDIRDLVCVHGSRASNEYCEVTFKKGSKFEKTHGVTSMDVVTVEFL